MRRPSRRSSRAIATRLAPTCSSSATPRGCRCSPPAMPVATSRRRRLAIDRTRAGAPATLATMAHPRGILQLVSVPVVIGFDPVEQPRAAQRRHAARRWAGARPAGVDRQRTRVRDGIGRSSRRPSARPRRRRWRPCSIAMPARCRSGRPATPGTAMRSSPWPARVGRRPRRAAAGGAALDRRGRRHAAQRAHRARGDRAADRAGRQRRELRRRPHHHASALGADHVDARDGAHRHADAATAARADARLGRRGRAYAGRHLRRDDPGHRPLPAAGCRTRPAHRARAALHRHRPRDSQPADDRARGRCAGCAARTIPTVADAAADIEEQVQRLDRVVNEVLDFARPVHLDVAPASLHAVCRRSRRCMRGRRDRAAGDAARSTMPPMPSRPTPIGCAPCS